MKNDCVINYLHIKKMTIKKLAELLGVSNEHLGNTLRRRELANAEKEIIYQAIATGQRQEFHFWGECRRCGEVFERVDKEYLCPICAGKANIKRETIKRRRKNQPEFSVREMAVAAGRLGMSYGELVDNLARGLIDREVIAKKIKEK